MKCRFVGDLAYILCARSRQFFGEARLPAAAPSFTAHHNNGPAMCDSFDHGNFAASSSSLYTTAATVPSVSTRC